MALLWRFAITISALFIVRSRSKLQTNIYAYRNRDRSIARTVCNVFDADILALTAYMYIERRHKQQCLSCTCHTKSVSQTFMFMLCVKVLCHCRLWQQICVTFVPNCAVNRVVVTPVE